jgi:glucans biosynthesis protein
MTGKSERDASAPPVKAGPGRRRVLLSGLSGLALLAAGRGLARAESAPPPPPSVTLDTVRQIARDLAKSDFKPPAPQPDPLAKLSYDDWRKIRYRFEKAIWLDDPSPFKLEFFHPGHLQGSRIEVDLVDGPTVTRVAFDRAMFDYGDVKLPDSVWKDIGFAGFRIHHALNTNSPRDEVIAFLGASYFRAIGKGQVYGLSARGLAINTALRSGEEFPLFRRFWIVKPAADAPTLQFYALLDSQSLTGAYGFKLRPGDVTQLEVEAELFLRRPVEKLGLAPLTSMFLFGEGGSGPFRDFRPEVHDSDGLQLQNGSGEWLWRPLRNPQALSLSGFALENPRGFGLLQRDRDFDHYQDLEAMYQARPTAWVEPGEGWGKGRVELLELPADREIYDNIASYWVGDKPAQGGASVPFSYRLSWALDQIAQPPGGRVVATRMAPEADARKMRFILDFSGGPLGGLRPDAPVEGVVTARGGTAGSIITQRNPFVNGQRLIFDVHRDGDGPVELRAFLRNADQVMTETWTYAWQG